MENAADALKIVMAIMIFAIGLAMLFSMASQARQTSSVLISEIDDTKYYQFHGNANPEEQKFYKYADGTGKMDKNGNRIVTIEEIVPVLYRYYYENYGVTIVEKNGNIAARFDMNTEDMCNRWPKLTNRDKYIFITETNKIYKQVNDLAKKVGRSKAINEIGITTNPQNPNIDGKFEITETLTNYFKKWYPQKPIASNSRTYSCIWTGTPRMDSTKNRC